MARTVGARNAGVQLAVKFLAGNAKPFQALIFSEVSLDFVASQRSRLVVSDLSKSPSIESRVEDWGNHVVTSHACPSSMTTDVWSSTPTRSTHTWAPAFSAI